MPRRNPPRARRPDPTRDDTRPSGLGAHFRADGTPKSAYPSRADALFVAGERQRESGVVLNAYRCSVCEAWHVGNPPREL